MPSPRVLFLYSEIAEYFLACCRAMVVTGAEVHVVCWPVNPEAPFIFGASEGIILYDRRSYSKAALLKLVSTVKPDLIVCSGWIDKDYLKVCKHFKKEIPTVLTLDNHWQSTIKQRLACLLSPLFLMSRFSWCWVPGQFQYTYAQKLGFPNERIRTGFYSADVNLYAGMHLQFVKEKEQHFPHRFLYVGRYYEFKGIPDLWKAFSELQRESPNDWELWCLGTGDLPPMNHPKIRHFGFVQPSDIANFIRDTGVFVLPSHKEPWGVVVHEYAAAGFPIVCSNEVGSAPQFIEQNVNGYIYPSRDLKELKRILQEIMLKSDSELVEMGNKSSLKSQSITPENWVETLKEMMQKKIN